MIKVAVMKALILAIQDNQISDEFVDASNVETMADVKKLASDWNAQKTTTAKDANATAKPDKAEADITAWAAKGKAEAKA